jgi:hypothetical protein
MATRLLLGWGMAIAKITGNGLITIAVLVAGLWGCLLTEHKIMVEAQKRQARELIEIRHLRDTRFTVPAALPVSRGNSVRPVAS